MIIFRFNLDLDKNKFKTSNDDTTIEAIDVHEHTCFGYMIYAHLFDKNEVGSDSGVHYWSVKALQTEGYQGYESGGIFNASVCYRSIGVTTVQNDEIIRQ